MGVRRRYLCTPYCPSDVSATQVFEEMSPRMSTLSDPRDTTLGRFGFEQMCTTRHTGVRMRFAHRIELGVLMTVMEMQPRSRPSVPWTEVCVTDHDRPVSSKLHPRPDAGARPVIRTLDRGRQTATRSVAPGRRVLVRPASAERVRACGSEARSSAPVVDDVPTWALVACGIVFGILMLLALALLGGPAYA